VKTIAGGAEITVIFNGDLVEADSKKRSHQLITRNKADLTRIATETIAPLVDISTRAFFIRGTEAHVGKSAQYEEEIAADCSIAVKSSETVTSWWSLYADIGGVCFDVSHHGKLSTKPWNRPNALITHTFEKMLAYQKRGERVPDVFVQAHNHKSGDTGGNLDSLGVACLAWQLQTEYSIRIATAEISDIGGLIFVIENGAYTWQKVQYKPKPRRPWVLKTS
jgi:acyl carrier protein